MKNYKIKLNSVTTFIFDVDGVFTDGKVYLINDDVIRALQSKDGYAVQYATKIGYKIFIITGGNSQQVKDRLLNLGVNEVHLSVKRKLTCFEDIILRFNLTPDEVLYMGDDIPDIPVLKKVGVSTCPQDACSDVKMLVDYQSHCKGGFGCVRDVIEQTLRLQGKWLMEEAFEW
ncbi:MAG: HAD family hydrolase [Bacteroidetes bacterium]|nr:HAD family hydrolase [Bacteroidota bacterium]